MKVCLFLSAMSLNQLMTSLVLLHWLNLVLVLTVDTMFSRSCLLILPISDSVGFMIEFDRYRYTDTDTDTDISVSVREYSNRYQYPPNLPNRTDSRYRYIGMIPIPGSYRYSYRYYIKGPQAQFSEFNFL